MLNDPTLGLYTVMRDNRQEPDIDDGTIKVGGPHVAATNGSLHEDLLKVFSEIADGKLETPLKL